MVRFNTLPNLEAVASVALRSASIDGLQGVHSSVPSSPAYPLIIVQRLGGQPAVRQYLDQARIQVDVWGGARGDGPGAPTKSDILDIAQEARTTLLELEGATINDPVSVFVSAVEDASGLSWLPDPASGRDRYVFSMWIYGRSLGDAS